MSFTRICQHCGGAFESETKTRVQKYCSRKCQGLAARRRVTLGCEVCGQSFEVLTWRTERTDAQRVRYCSLGCAYTRQKNHRTPWNKGQTKETDERLQKYSEDQKRRAAENPTLGRGTNHPFHGKKHTAEAREQMRAKAKGRVPTPAMLEALKLGQQYFRGRTIETDAILRARNAQAGFTKRGRKNPRHSDWAKSYYIAHPEKHPLHIVAQRGHETNIERTMRLALEKARIPFERQYHVHGLWLDFAIPERLLAIEVDGAYWHSSERDAIRDARLQKLGWVVLHFEEQRVLRRVDDCVAEVLVRLDELNQRQWLNPLPEPHPLPPDALPFQNHVQLPLPLE